MVHETMKLNDIMKDTNTQNMSNGYFAVCLDKTYRDMIKQNATMDVVRGDHITIAYKPNDDTFKRLSKLVGKRVNAHVNELRANDNIEAFWVESMFYDSYSLTTNEKELLRVDSGAPHITISHKTDIKPNEAGTMFTNPTRQEKKVGYVEGTFKWIEFKKRQIL